MSSAKILLPKRRVAGVVWLVISGLVLAGIGCFIWLSMKRVEAPLLDERSRSELEFRDGRFCRPGSAQPFTGFVTDFYDGGELKSRSMVSNGLLEGLSEGWFTNGQKQVEEYFISGVSHGRRTKWYPNGAKHSEAMIVNGKLHGAFQRWYENGQLSERVELSDGQPSGLSLAYHPDGSLKARVTLQDGRVLEQQSWQEGGHKE